MTSITDLNNADAIRALKSTEIDDVAGAATFLRPLAYNIFLSTILPGKWVMPADQHTGEGTFVPLRYGSRI